MQGRCVAEDPETGTEIVLAESWLVIIVSLGKEISAVNTVAWELNRATISRFT